jgi:hypothetical protein
MIVMLLLTMAFFRYFTAAIPDPPDSRFFPRCVLPFSETRDRAQHSVWILQSEQETLFFMTRQSGSSICVLGNQKNHAVPLCFVHHRALRLAVFTGIIVVIIV